MPPPRLYSVTRTPQQPRITESIVAKMSMLSDFFKSKEEKEKEMLREQRRQATRTQRELEHERVVLERQERQILADIKKLATKGQMDSAKTLAKELVRVRAQKDKLLNMKIQVQATQSRATTMRATQSSVKAMAGATRAMAVAGQSMSIPAMQKTAMEYQKQSDMLDMKGEMMDDMFENPEEDAEADDVVDQVFEEIGLDITSMMPSAQKGELVHAGKGKAAVKEDDVTDDELKKMLAQLK
eukprot:TRINITY_DN1454_c0_g1_i1.p2 TRINITY_DN1454_c0_g1~~TRINITY_DN1454_c0_g1_i1.p2  ORF type:complete len:241 (+),score=64.77 TRINITY_DN1454_c0_g1_i1:1267-1989(+)